VTGEARQPDRSQKRREEIGFSDRAVRKDAKGLHHQIRQKRLNNKLEKKKRRGELKGVCTRRQPLAKARGVR